MNFPNKKKSIKNFIKRKKVYAQTNVRDENQNSQTRVFHFTFESIHDRTLKNLKN